MSAALEAKIAGLQTEQKALSLQIQEFETKEKLDSADIIVLKGLNEKSQEVINSFRTLKETAGHQADLLELFGAKPKTDETLSEKIKRETGVDTQSLAAKFREANPTWLPGQHMKSVQEDASLLVRTREQMQERALIGGGATSAGAAVANIRIRNVDNGGLFREITALDLFTRIPVTEGKTVDFAELATITNNAGETPEATDSTTQSLVTGLKPASDATSLLRQATIWAIAHWIDVTRQTYMDAAMFAALIEEFLEYGVMEQLEDAVINGANTPTTNIVGIINTSGVQTQAYATDLLVTARKCLTKVRKYAKPNAFLMHPETWETIELAKDSEGRFYYAGPQNQGPAILWGRPVIESQAVPTTNFILADWKFGAIFDREQYNLYSTDSDGDKFKKNVLTIMGEGFFGMGLLRRKAFCVGATS